MCLEHGHLGGVGGGNLPNPPRLQIGNPWGKDIHSRRDLERKKYSGATLPAPESEEVVETVDEGARSVLELLGGLGRTKNTKANKWAMTVIEASSWVGLIRNSELWDAIFKDLKAKVGWDLEKAQGLHKQISSFGIEKAMADFQGIMWDKKLHPDTIEKAIFWAKTVKAIKWVNAMIQDARDEREWETTYNLKVPAIVANNLYPIFAKLWMKGIQDRYRMATLEANITGAISQIEVLANNKWEMDEVIKWVKESGETIRANTEELYRQYASMVYASEVMEFHLTEKQQELATGKFDAITRTTKEQEISMLERQIADIGAMIRFIEARAIIETHNSERADITAQNIENEYLMAMYVLAQKIQNYMVQEGIIKWVNLGAALQGLKNEAMRSFFEDQKALNNLQTQLEKSGLDFLVDLNKQILSLQANIEKNNATLSTISDKQQAQLGEISNSIEKLKTTAVPQLVDMRGSSSEDFSSEEEA